MLRVVIGGDLYPGTASTPLLRQGDAAAVFDGLVNVFQSSDLAIANLEGPLVQSQSPIDKVGPLHAVDEQCVRGIRAAGFQVMNLANNHAMDHGSRGLKNTIRLCEEHGLSTVGAGENRAAASRLLVKSVKGVRIGILSYTEHEFGCATEEEWGTNPIDVIQFVRGIEEIRKACDLLVVLLHAGNEYSPYPRPDIRELSHFFVEQGAGVVVCQQPHCAGCYEAYEAGHIIYGQGFLLFDEMRGRATCQEGFLVQLEIDQGMRTNLKVVPYRHSPEKPGPLRLSLDNEQEFLGRLERRNEAIGRAGFVEQNWKEFCRGRKDNYLALIHGYGRRVREFDQKLRFLRFFYSEKRLRMMLHLIRCESHREILLQVLADASSEDERNGTRTILLPQSKPGTVSAALKDGAT